MSLENIRQNTETMIEVLTNYDYLVKQKEQFQNSLTGKKDEKTIKQIEDINKKILITREYLLKLVTKMDKLVGEEIGK